MIGTRKSDFSQGSIAKNILSLAIPLTLAQLTVVLYNVVDRAFIGHIDAVGRDAFTGIGLVMPITYIINAFANLCGTGGAPLCSIARGKNDDKRAQRIMGVSFSFLLLSGGALTLFFYLFHEPILYLSGGSPETVSHARSYLLIYLAGTIPVMIGLGMNPFINAQGFGKTGMMTTLLGAVINLILDPIFIFGLNMGVQGAALATVIAQTCSAAWVLVFLTGPSAILQLSRESLGLDAAILKRVCSLGLTGFTFSVTNSLVQALGNAQLQTYGSVTGNGSLYVAAMTAITSIREIVFQPIRGLTQGAQPVIGYNYGAGQYSRVRESIRFLTVSCLSYNGMIWRVLMLFP
ncbi:MAG: MATE family efflux transporter, partial [Oscillospiraceae bacterium]|nr:MATE family efflux transporter [Oscillospiraceae bacterium]